MLLLSPSLPTPNHSGISPIVTSTNITAHYLPYYIFTYTTLSSGSTTYHQSIPVYSGYHHRGSLADVLHLDTFLDSPTLSSKLPWDDSWLLYYHPPLQDSRRRRRLTLDVNVELDPWSSHRSQSWSKILTSPDYEENTSFNLISSARLVLPVWIVEYRLLGLPFRCAVSGCHSSPDSSSPHSIPSSSPEIKSLTDHRLLGGEGISGKGTDRILSMLDFITRPRYRYDSPVRRTSSLFYLLAPVFRFVLPRIPQFLLAGVVIGGFKKVLVPYYLEVRSWEEAKLEREGDVGGGKRGGKVS